MKIPKAIIIDGIASLSLYSYTKAHSSITYLSRMNTCGILCVSAGMSKKCPE